MAAYDKYMEYYRRYANLMYGGEQYLSPSEISAFKTYEEEIKRQGKEAEQSALESATQRGVLQSGITDKYIATTVTQPLQSALAGLAMEKAKMTAIEKARRREEIKQMAMTEMMRDEEKSGKLWKTIGKLTGTAIGAGVGFFAGGGPAGILPGAAAANQLTSGLFGGLSETDWDDIIRWNRMWEKQTNEESEEEVNGGEI